jgi:hypothetical protein
MNQYASVWAPGQSLCDCKAIDAPVPVNPVQITATILTQIHPAVLLWNFVSAAVQELDRQSHTGVWRDRSGPARPAAIPIARNLVERFLEGRVVFAERRKPCGNIEWPYQLRCWFFWAGR